MITLSAEEAGAALGLPPLAASVPGISIDSRSVRDGDLFIAIRGEHFDGHDFVEAALQAGASGVVVERRTGGGPVYEVESTLGALCALAREVRRKSNVLVFAITGSVGKTSTKDLLGSMVGRVRRVVVTASNQNNEVGVPLTLLAIDAGTEAVVVEMGMRGLGQIAALAAVAEPDVGIITNIHPVHLELLGSLEGIAQAKAELVHGLRPGGVAVVPAECAVLQPFIDGLAQPVVTWGVDVAMGTADVTGSLLGLASEKGGRLLLRWPGGEVEVEGVHVAGHRLANAVCAAAACYAAGLDVRECARGVRGVRDSKGRGETLRLPGLCVIDDTYNANPAAVRAALDDLVRVAGSMGGRPVAVLGDMLELGPQADSYHRETGLYAAEIGVRALWGVGALARGMLEGFESGWRAKSTSGCEWYGGHVGSAEESSIIMAGLREGDVVLFKASRSMRLETVMQRVVEEAQKGRWRRGPGCEPEGPWAEEETR